MKAVMLASLLSVFSFGIALSQPGGGNYTLGILQEEFACSGGNCTTNCVGPGGPQQITKYTQIQAFLLSQPDRLWLKITNVSPPGSFHIIVLGVGDRCTFDGVADDIRPAPGGSSPLGGLTTNPLEYVIGQQCL